MYAPYPLHFTPSHSPPPPPQKQFQSFAKKNGLKWLDYPMLLAFREDEWVIFELESETHYI